jgi:hypothetical protein
MLILQRNYKELFLHPVTSKLYHNKTTHFSLIFHRATEIMKGMKWEGNDNIKMNFKATGLEDVIWIHLAQNMVQRWDFMKTAIKLVGQ